MNLDYLENYLGLVQYMNFTKAAEALHISQSTLSKQIAMLEYSLKTELIKRDSRTISLTVAGEYLAEQGTKLVKMIHNVEHNLMLISNQGEGPLIISATSDGSSQIYTAMSQFQTAFPQADLIIKRDVMKDVVHAVLDGTADIGITTDYVFESVTKNDPPTLCGTRVLEKRPFYLLIPEDDPLASRTSISLEELPEGSHVAIAENIQEHIDKLSPESLKKLSRLTLLPPQGHDLISWEDMVVQVRLHKYYLISPVPNLSNGCARLRIEDEFYNYYNLILIWRKDNHNKFLPHFVAAMDSTLGLSQEK